MTTALVSRLAILLETGLPTIYRAAVQVARVDVGRGPTVRHHGWVKVRISLWVSYCCHGLEENIRFSFNSGLREAPMTLL